MLTATTETTSAQARTTNQVNSRLRPREDEIPGRRKLTLRVKGADRGHGGENGNAQGNLHEMAKECSP